MSLFKQKKLSLDEILKGIETLSDDERSRLNDALAAPQAPEAPPASEEGPENVGNEDNSSEDGEDPAPDNAAQEDPTDELEDPNTTEDAEDPAAPADGGEPESQPKVGDPAPETPPEDVDTTLAALRARLESMTELIAALSNRCDALTERLDSGSFGNYSPGMPQGSIDEDPAGMTPTMRSYTRKQTYR